MAIGGSRGVDDGFYSAGGDNSLNAWFVAVEFTHNLMAGNYANTFCNFAI